MTEREKVTRGLEAHANPKTCETCAGEYCPYYDRDGSYTAVTCSSFLAADALALLKEQEARVLALEEVLNADDFVWAEIYTPKKWSWCVVYAKISPLVGNDEIVLIEEDCGTGWARNKAEYGKRGFLDGGWRCWSARPTEELRKAVKWE